MQGPKYGNFLLPLTCCHSHLGLTAETELQERLPTSAQCFLSSHSTAQPGNKIKALILLQLESMAKLLHIKMLIADFSPTSINLPHLLDPFYIPYKHLAHSHHLNQKGSAVAKGETAFQDLLDWM